jgi:hypothetical protein
MRTRNNAKQIVIIFLIFLFTHTIVDVVESGEPIRSNEKIVIDSLFEAITAGKSIKFRDINQWSQKERQTLLRYIRDAEGEEKQAQYVTVSLADVNDDGEKEIFVQVFGSSYWCGSHGCTLMILQEQKGEWKRVLNTKEHQEVVMLNTKNHGYCDIAFIDSFDKFSKKKIAIWRFEGKYYAPYTFREVEYDKRKKQTTVTTYIIINRKEILIEKFVE